MSTTFDYLPRNEAPIFPPQATHHPGPLRETSNGRLGVSGLGLVSGRGKDVFSGGRGGATDGRGWRVIFVPLAGVAGWLSTLLQVQ